MAKDGGFTITRLLFAKSVECSDCPQEGRVFVFFYKSNPKKQDKGASSEQAKNAGMVKEVLPNKRLVLLNMYLERDWRCGKQTFLLIVEVTERTIDNKGEHILVLQVEMQGRWDRFWLPLNEMNEEHLGSCEQFRPEIMTHLAQERLTSGKFLHSLVSLDLGAFIYKLICQIEMMRPQKDKESLSGSHVPGGKVCRTRHKVGAGLRAQLHRTRQAV